jgi:integrase
MMEEKLEEFKNWMNLKGLSDDTKNRYEYIVSKFIDYCKRNKIELNKESVIKFIQEIEDKTGNYKRFVFTILRRFFKICNLEWFSEKDEDIYRPKLSQPRRTIINIEDFNSLMNACDYEWERIALRILIETGCRRKQLTLMLKEHFNQDKGTIYIPPIKKSMERVEYISSELTNSIKEYLKKRYDKYPYLLVDEKGKPLTPMKVTTMFNKLKRRLGMENKWFGLHAFRRAWATLLYKGGMGEKEIQDAGGWKSPLMPSIYIRLTPIEVMEKEKKVHPLKSEKSK